MMENIVTYLSEKHKDQLTTNSWSTTLSRQKINKDNYQL